MAKTYLIAEAGVNHNGSLDLAKKLIDAASEAGADAVKFQTFRADRLVTTKAKKAPYQRRLTGKDETQFDMIKRLELSKEDHLKLIAHCVARKIAFLSSPFDEESADMLERLGVERFKIPSGEITNLPFLRHVAAKGRSLLISTGMSTLAEVDQALDAVAAAGNKQVTLLHCVTEYPAPVDQVNLRAMETLRRAFNLPVGYSDHSPGIEIAIAAVALGAEVIEKHFTLDRTLPGPDHRASLEPAELTELARAIRNVESALGDGVKRPAPCELSNIRVARKSLVTARGLRKSERLTTQNVTIKRPGTGISPADMDKALGLVVTCDVEADTPITWEMLRQ